MFFTIIITDVATLFHISPSCPWPHHHSRSPIISPRASSFCPTHNNNHAAGGLITMFRRPLLCTEPYHTRWAIIVLPRAPHSYLAEGSRSLNAIYTRCLITMSGPLSPFPGTHYFASNLTTLSGMSSLSPVPYYPCNRGNTILS